MSSIPMQPTSLALVAALAVSSLFASQAAATDRLSRATPDGAAPARKVAAAATIQELPAIESGASSTATVTLMVDRAKIMRLPERTQTVIVGNPSIADVTLQKNGVVVLTGKSYGLTNLIALDAAGAMLVESTVSVQAATDSIVVVQRGMDRESYSCTPRCQPSMLLGDSTKYFGEVTAQASQRNATAAQR